MTARAHPVAAVAVLAICAALWIALPVRDDLGRPLPLSFQFGVVFGIVLQRGRFCFWCNLRDWLDRRDGKGLLAIGVALAAGTVGHAIVLGGWLPDPSTGRLPPDAHVGPVSWTLVLGALVFGLGMAVSGSCISAHLYRLGEGSGGSVATLAGVLAGFVLGFLSWNTLYLWETWRALPLWLPVWLGYAGTVAATLGLLAVAAAALARQASPQAAAAAPGWLQAVIRDRWPPVPVGLLVGALATLAYLRVGPLGVTAEIGSIARTGADAAGLLPETLQGLDGLAGCATVVKQALLSRNGVFVLGLILGSLASALAAGQWVPVRPAVRALPRLVLGGVLLGWGAMVSLGCTVGVLLSGTMAGAVSGWVFLVFCLCGALLGRRLRFR